MRTILLIAYHFPPILGSSGVQRTLRFAQHLPAHGWRPIVLTIDPRAYPAVGESRGNEIPEGLEVHRARGFDAARQLSIWGRYPLRFARPDRYASWAWWAVRQAVRLVSQRQVTVLWSTFPIATAHKIGLTVARRTGLPWIAEFRDPMWQGEQYPPSPAVNAEWSRLERDVFTAATRVVVTTPGSHRLYRRRFPDIGAEKVSIIENGFDEDTFRRAESRGSVRRTPVVASLPGPAVLLHSGIIYPSERDPTCFFSAVAALKESGVVDATSLRVILRASGHDGCFQAMIDELRIADIVELAPAIPYLEALQEMLAADGLLLMQASNCNDQIPAKLYEYIRAGRPIVALTDPEGDTASTLRSAGGAVFARLDSVTEIKAALLDFLARKRNGTLTGADAEYVGSCSREGRTRELATMLDAITASRKN